MATALAHSPTRQPLTFTGSDAGSAANDAGPQIGPEPPSNCRSTGSTACEDCDVWAAAPPAPTRHALPVDAGPASILDEVYVSLPNGRPYPGDLVADILEYRILRARTLSGTALHAEDLDRYDTLQALLCSSDDDQHHGHGRAYHRFGLRMPGRLRVSQGRGATIYEVGIDNVSAGGVKLFGARAHAAGERVQLLLPQQDDERTIVLPARVAWMKGAAVGLMFAGAARWR